MEGKIINSLKPPLTKRASEEGYCKLNEIPGSGGCLRQKKTYRLLKVSHKFLNFWGKTIWEDYDKHWGRVVKFLKYIIGY